MKKFWVGVVVSFVILLAMTPEETKAASKAGGAFVNDGVGIVWMYADSTILRNDWLKINGLVYHTDEAGHVQIGLVNVKGKNYFLYPNGTMLKSSFTQIGDGIYYFGADGVMVTNKTINGFKIGPDGKVIMPTVTAQTPQTVTAEQVAASSTDRATLLATVQSIIGSVTNDSMSQEEKLLACYNYVMARVKYVRTYETPSGDWTPGYAMQVYQTGTGNCYRYAAAFAYLAKGLGYDVKVITGNVHAARGGVTPHGWTEVCIDGNWYVFDPELQAAKPGRNLFKQTYDTYPIKPLIKALEWPVYF